MSPWSSAAYDVTEAPCTTCGTTVAFDNGEAWLCVAGHPNCHDHSTCECGEGHE